jgi:hypothetical protein
MPKRQVFYSFHYANDVRRVQLVRNIGVIEGNAPVAPNAWEEVKRGGDTAIQRWIDDNMAYRSCVIVLIGSQTANRKWINYEIKKAWVDKKGLMGIHIHNLKDPINGTSSMGENPFDYLTLGGNPLSKYVVTHNPSSYDAYNDIRNNIDKWIESAILSAQRR